jgi:hypothetical protein
MWLDPKDTQFYVILAAFELFFENIVLKLQYSAFQINVNCRE